MEIVDTIHLKVLQQFESQAIFQFLLIETWKMKCCGILLLAIKEKKFPTDLMWELQMIQKLFLSCVTV